MKRNKITILLFVLSIVFAWNVESALNWQETNNGDFADGTFSSTTLLGIGSGAYIALSTTTFPGWWNTSWRYKMPVYVWNLSANILTDYQVCITLNTASLISAGKMNSNCSDIRFIDSDGVTVLNYWIESGINTASTKIWVKVPYISSGTYKTIYMYYGNPRAIAVSNPVTTFDVYDDFSTNPNTNGRWTVYTTGNAADEAVWRNDGDDPDMEWFLTSSITARACAVFANVNLPASWKARFRYKVTNNTGRDILDGHEGFTFMFYKNRTPYETGRPDIGNRLGFTAGGSNVSGYGLEIDALADGVDGNQNGHFALIKDSPLLSHLTYYVLQNNVKTTDERWHDVEVKFITWQTSSTLWALVDDGTLFTARGYTANFDRTYTGVGFSAATGWGWQPNAHIIDDFILQKANDPEPTCSFGDEIPQIGYYTSGIYYSNWLSSTVAIRNYEAGVPVSTVTLYCKISKITWNAELSPGTTIEVYILGSNSPTWEKVDNRDTEISAEGYYIRYSCILYGNSFNSPKFLDINIEYKTHPVAVITISTYTGRMGETVTFDASNSYDADGTINYYFWDFGDGDIGYGINPVNTFPSANTTRTYKVTLTIQDNDGFLSKYYYTLIYPPFPPLEEPVVYNPSKAEAGQDRITRIYENVLLDGSSSYIGTDGVVKACWAYAPLGRDDWATGSWTFIVRPGTIKDNLVVNYYFVNTGTYTVGLILLDNQDRMVSTDTIRVVVKGIPQANIQSNNQIISENKIVVGQGENIIFDATKSIYPGDKIISYFWDFGDGLTSTSPVVSYTYASVTSSYTVKLTVTGNDGLQNTNTIYVIVSARPVPSAEFDSIVEEGQKVSFDASKSYDIDGSIVSYMWDFGDGSKALGVKTTHIYAKPKTYKVILTVIDNLGLKNSKEYDIVIKASSKDISEGWFSKEEINVYPVPCRIGKQNMKFKYYLPEESNVFIAIYDLMGKMIKNFEFRQGENNTRHGWNEIEWDGRNISNEFVESGVYIVKMLISKGDIKSYRTQKIAVYRAN